MSETTVTGADVHVRFCPSPTGTPHVGMVRTCLFNWAYARHTGGIFVFCIGNTDVARDSQESFDQIIESLQWLGLDWDEDVGRGGPHGSYRQSKRMDIYRDVAARLLEAGYAYESYSTPEEIKECHRARGEGPKFGYDGSDRNLTEEKIAAFRAEGRQPVLRLRMSDEGIMFADLIRGEITSKVGSVPGYVIVHVNGHPLYTLVNPIDGTLTEITHVLYGRDLLPSTPRRIALHRAFEAIGVAKFMPRFGHLPYVMGGGNKKLSRRDPESNLLLHKAAGMIPEGLNNCLALLGWSIAADRDIFSMEEMAQAFNISGVNPNPARFDQEEAVAINAEQIRLLDDEDFRDCLVSFLRCDEVVSADSFEALTDRERKILTGTAPLIQTRIQLLGEATGMLAFLFVADDTLEMDEEAVSRLKDSAANVLDAVIEAVEGLTELTTAALEESLRARIVDEMGVKPRLAFGPLRVVVTGRQVSPPLFESMEILGRDSSLTRLRALRASLA